MGSDNGPASHFSKSARQDLIINTEVTTPANRLRRPSTGLVHPISDLGNYIPAVLPLFRVCEVFLLR